MIDIKKRYTTMSGMEVRLYTVDGFDKDYPVVGEVHQEVGKGEGESYWRLDKWDANGCSGIGHLQNLKEAKETREIKKYLYVLKDGTYELCDYMDSWKERPYLSKKLFAIVPINITCKEGEGL